MEEEELVDFEVVQYPRLPQPFRSIVKVLDGIIEEAWTAIEGRPRSKRRWLEPEKSFCGEVACAKVCGDDELLIASTDGTLRVAGRPPFVKALDALTTMSEPCENRVAVAGASEDRRDVVALVEVCENGVLAHGLAPEATTALALSSAWLCATGAAVTRVYAVERTVLSPVFELLEPVRGIHFLRLPGKPPMILGHRANVARKLALVHPDRGEGETPLEEPEIAAEWTLPSAVTCSAVARPDCLGATAVGAFGFDSGTVAIWDLQLDVCRYVLKRHAKARCAAVAFHQRKYLASAGADGSIHVYDLTTAPPDFSVAFRRDIDDVSALHALDAAPVALAVGKAHLVLYDLRRCTVMGASQNEGGDLAVAASEVAFVVATTKTAKTYAAKGILHQLHDDIESSENEEDPVPRAFDHRGCDADHGPPSSPARREANSLLRGKEEHASDTLAAVAALGAAEKGQMRGCSYIDTQALADAVLKEAAQHRERREEELLTALRGIHTTTKLGASSS